MKDFNYHLRVAHVTVIESTGVPVYSVAAPTDDDGNYILLTSIESQDINSKCNRRFKDIAITVDIVTKFNKPSTGTYEIADNYATSILTKILEEKQIAASMLPDFQVNTSKLDGDRYLTEDTQSTKVIRRILTFRYSILQLN